MDSWIYPCIQVSMDTWIVGYLKLFSIRILGCLDISALLDTWLAKNAWISMYPDMQLSGYHISNYREDKKKQKNRRFMKRLHLSAA